MNRPADIARRRCLSDDIFDRMVRAIKSGAYGPDERLPTEHDLAAEFEVSRPTIREALRRLREQGLIYSRRGAGSFVRQTGLREPLGFGQLASIADLDRCYEFRLTLEPEGAARAALRHDAQALETISRQLGLMRDATERARHREDADFAFHLAIAEASGNPYFATAMQALKDHIAVGMQFHGAALKAAPMGLEEVYDEHAAIFAAIRARKADTARDLMARHLKGSRDRLFEGRATNTSPGI